MSKPTIFFSHSSRDKRELALLKDLFVQKTGGSIDVFLSSDGQSIPLGRNWVHRIQEALENASIMIVFVSPNSIRSNWIFFEAGYAYSKKIRVVPVGFLGVDLTTLPPPLSLLQGFNITSEEGLSNLLALANEVFGHAHNSKFTAEEYRNVCMSNSVLSSKIFGDYGPLIDNIYFKLSKRIGSLDADPLSALERIIEMLKEENIEHTRADNAVSFHGVSIYSEYDDELTIAIDSGIADVSFPIVERVIREVRSKGIRDIVVRLDFIKAVDCLTGQHKVTGRLYGSDIKLSDNDHLIFKDIEFQVSHLYSFSVHGGSRRGATYLSMIFHCDEIPVSQIRELLNFLFEREVLYLESESYELMT